MNCLMMIKVKKAVLMILTISSLNFCFLCLLFMQMGKYLLNENLIIERIR